MKIVIADSSALYRTGVQLALDEAGIAIDAIGVDHFEDLADTLDSIRGSVVLIIDARLRGMEQLSELKALMKRPGTRVLMLTDNKDTAFMRRALFNGVHGVVAKTADLQEMGKAIRTVINGYIWRYDDDAATARLDEQHTRLGYALCRLSRQENNVLKLLRHGLRNKQIANQMCLTEQTIKTHVSSILRKLEIDNRTQLVIAVGKSEFSQMQRDNAGMDRFWN